jgi:hypothetical protein
MISKPDNLRELLVSFPVITIKITERRITMRSDIGSGIVAGLIGGVFFGIIMQMMNAPTPQGGQMPMMAMVAMVVRSTVSLSVGSIICLTARSSAQFLAGCSVAACKALLQGLAGVPRTGLYGGSWER